MKIFRFLVLIIIIIGILSVSLPVWGVDVSEYNRAIEAYRDVLLGNADYFSVDNYYAENNWYNLNDVYSISTGVYDYQVKVIEFSIIDMDGDGIPEIILVMSIPNGDKTVLHYENDIVYGYYSWFRAMRNIKKDGTFDWSGGAGYTGFDRLQFSNGLCERKTLGYRDGGLYFINNEEVSEEEFEPFWNEQNQKEDADWYEFNDENIDKFLQTIPVAAPKTGDNSIIFALVIFAITGFCTKAHFLKGVASHSRRWPCNIT